MGLWILRVSGPLGKYEPEREDRKTTIVNVSSRQQQQQQQQQPGVTKAITCWSLKTQLFENREGA